MLERLDNKYIVSHAILDQAAPAFAEVFDVLEIDGLRAFTYDTCYFDDHKRQSYFDHHQGRRRRCKVRVRKYSDAGLCFVEIKLKDKRGVTVKRRMSYDSDLFRVLDNAAMDHINASHQGLYGEAFPLDLCPIIEMRYRRMTLVAREGGERMTIDSDIEFRSGSMLRKVSKDMVIVETKSARGNGLADKVLRACHLHPVPGCSKYCIGMAALEKVNRMNHFLPALRMLGMVPGQGVVLGQAQAAVMLAAA
ncbi:MAG: polyphosphate polymerase domain-containing protein [Pseudorhodobacter sp.]|nr:polyphosphate polymerase domain-containing protein [Pseudorhodobacter sp.]